MEKWMRNMVQRIKEAKEIGIMLNPESDEPETIIPSVYDKLLMHDIAISFQSYFQRCYKNNIIND